MRKPATPDAEPPYTCPTFDAAIQEIETARRANASLRDVLGQWRDMAQYWESEADIKESEKTDLNNTIENLRSEIRELKDELQDAHVTITNIQHDLSTYQ